MAVRRFEKLTYEDYCAFPDDGVRRELIDGEVVVTPSPSQRHQKLVLRITLALGNHVETYGGGDVYIAPFDVLFTHQDVVQPDVLFVADEDLSRLTPANLQGPPTLAVEVVSDSGRDRRLKMALYARYGVKEYWVVDPEADQIEVRRLGAEGYGKPEVLLPGEMLTTPLLPDLRIDLAHLFRR